MKDNRKRYFNSQYYNSKNQEYFKNILLNVMFKFLKRILFFLLVLKLNKFSRFDKYSSSLFFLNNSKWSEYIKLKHTSVRFAIKLQFTLHNDITAEMRQAIRRNDSSPHQQVTHRVASQPFDEIGTADDYRSRWWTESNDDVDS